MTTTEVITRYITDIPWESFPPLKDAADVYKVILESTFDLLPLYDKTISYNSDTWDFRDYFKHKNQTELCIPFGKLVSPELKDYAKMYVLQSILEKNTPGTPHKRIRTVKYLLEQIYKRYGYNSIYVITTEDIVSTICQLNIKNETKRFYLTGIIDFWSFLINYLGLELPVNLEQIERENQKVRSRAKRETESNKLPDIPLSLMKALVDAAIRVMRDPSEQYMERSFACMIIILSQLGLRPGDLLDLRVNQLKGIRLPNIKETAYFLHYTSNKPSRGLGPMYEFDMYCTELCKEAYDTLSCLRGSHPHAATVDYLYLPYNRIKKEGLSLLQRYPVTIEKFNGEFQRFVFKYLKETCSKTYVGIPQKKLAFLAGVKKLKAESNKLFSIPDLRQFRVRVCTGLYNKGVPLTYIKKFMGHLTEEMLGYYCRPVDMYKENLKYSSMVIQSMVGDNDYPIGVNGNAIKEKLKEFVTRNNYNVYSDINDIIEALGNKLVIRAKTGGVCIKTSMVPCSDDKTTNRVLCSYNLCPNVYHFFWMIDVTYTDFLTAVKAYRLNEENGYVVEASRQKQIVRRIVSKRLSPELDELEKTITLRGKKSIIEQYPQLVSVIGELDIIKEEIKEWL